MQRQYFWTMKVYKQITLNFFCMPLLECSSTTWGFNKVVFLSFSAGKVTVPHMMLFFSFIQHLDEINKINKKAILIYFFVLLLILQLSQHVVCGSMIIVWKFFWNVWRVYMCIKKLTSTWDFNSNVNKCLESNLLLTTHSVF